MKKRILSILLTLCMLLCLVPTGVFAADCAEDLADPVIRIRLSPLGGGYYAIENGENCTRTAADFFQPGKAPKGAKITAVTPPTSPSIPVSVNVDSDGTLRCTKTEITTEIAFKSEPYTVTITSDDYAPITAPLTVRQYLNAGFEGPIQFKNRVYGDTYTYTCRVNNLGKNGVWSALIQNPDIFEIYQETTDITSEPGKSIYTVQIRAIKASARVTWIDFLYLSDTTMASSKDSSTVTTGGAVSTRPLTVTAGSATITEGDALPTDLVSCTGLLDSEGRTDDRDTVLENALGYQLLDANNEEVTADTARNTPGTYTVVPAATLKSGWGERYSLNKVNGTLTVEKRVDEQFTLTPGGRYYFDLSAMNIPGKVNSNLPDSTLHYVPFTYVGTVNAYSLKSEADKDTTSYEHSLFIANYNVTHTVSWNDLNTAGLLFGKDYAGGGVNYTLRAPSAGFHYSYDQNGGGTPRNNEWDVILDKAKQGNNDNTNGYVKNWQDIYSWGQDKSSASPPSGRSLRGYKSSRHWYTESATRADAALGFRPVLEVLNPGTLGPDGLKAVTLALGGGKLANSSEDIQIIVKTGSAFTAPVSDSLTRPDGDTGRYFMWLGSDGNLYAPGGSVPAAVTTLTAQWKDTEKPTGEIVIGTNKWREFLNKLTFGLFFNETQTVTINAADNSGTVFVSYLVTDRDLSEAELGSLVYRAYDEPFCIDPNGEYIVYAMLVDESLNITYLRSDRLTIDNVQPVITGIENGKTYCEAQTVTVDEKYVDTVTVNGTAVTLDESGSFTLAPADGEQKITVTDKAGNTAEMTVTVNDGHTGGTATCTEKAVCEVCGKAYGELDPNSHTDLKHIPAKAATGEAEGNIEYWYCEGCGKYYSDKDGTKEIKKADTVTVKLPKSPQTGDTSNLMLWIALLFVSGGVLTGVTVFDKRKRHSVK